MKPLKVRSAIICDQIRTEDNGKQIFIGVYTGDIVLSQIPATLPLVVWLEIAGAHSATPPKLELKVEWPGDSRTVETPFEAPEGVTVLLFIQLPPIQINSGGRFVVSLRAKGGKWQQLIDKGVLVAASASPAA